MAVARVPLLRASHRLRALGADPGGGCAPCTCSMRCGAAQYRCCIIPCSSRLSCVGICRGRAVPRMAKITHTNVGNSTIAVSPRLGAAVGDAVGRMVSLVGGGAEGDAVGGLEWSGL